MDEKEKKVMDNIVKTWNSFLELPTIHPDETNEARHHIHALQALLAIRICVRKGIIS